MPRTECVCAKTGRPAVTASPQKLAKLKLKRFKKSKEIFKQEVWPYGFQSWLWQVGLQLRKKGVFKSDESPNECFASLDAEAWKVYFMNGLSPLQAVELDIKEGGETA